MLKIIHIVMWNSPLLKLISKIDLSNSSSTSGVGCSDRGPCEILPLVEIPGWGFLSATSNGLLLSPSLACRADEPCIWLVQTNTSSMMLSLANPAAKKVNKVRNI